MNIAATGNRAHAIGIACLILALYAVKLFAATRFIDDDIFFWDIAHHVANQGMLATDLYGNAFGHEHYVGSIPFLYPLALTISVMAFQALKHPAATQLLSYLLLSGVVVIAYRNLTQSERCRTLPLLLLVILFTDGIVATSFSSLRYDAFLMVVTLLLYLSFDRYMSSEGRRGFTVLLCAGTISIFTHWQFLPMLCLIPLCILAFGHKNNTADRYRHAALFALAIAAGYGGYLGYLWMDDVRREAFTAQLVLFKLYSGQPMGMDILRLAKVFAGNLLLYNHLHSLLSVGLLIFLASPFLMLRHRDKFSGQDIRRHVVDVAFILSGVLPSLHMYYLGPRFAPLFFVLALMLWRRRALWLALLGGWEIAALFLLNYLGGTIIALYAFHIPGSSAFINYALLLFLLHLAYLLFKKNIPPHRLGIALCAVLACANILLNMDIPKALAASSNFASGSAVRAVEGKLMQTMPGAFRRTSTVTTPMVIYCDAKRHYFPIRMLDEQKQIRVRSFLPLFFFRSKEAQTRMLNDFFPKYILLSDDERKRFEKNPSLAEPYWQIIANRYTETGRLQEGDESRTVIYVNAAEGRASR